MEQMPAHRNGAPCLTSKLKRGGHGGKGAATGQDSAPGTQFCARRMPGPLSLAAHLLGGQDWRPTAS